MRDPWRKHDDTESPGDTGGYDPFNVVFWYGVMLPLALLVLAGLFVYWDAVPMGGRRGTRVWVSGWKVVWGSALISVGAATMLVARYLVPNVRRNDYSYVWPAGAGVTIICTGLLLLLLALLGV